MTFGRAPLAFYVAHLYLIHAATYCSVSRRALRRSSFSLTTAIFQRATASGLGGVYLIWLAVVALLYPFCRWVAAVKARRTDWWLSYV